MSGLIFLYNCFTDQECVKAFIASFGTASPLVFISVQIFQVLFAPIPGEITGFIGGYLFGATQGFIYSSLGLALGSWINFLAGRILGRRYVKKLIPARYMDKFDASLQRQGIIIVFLLFIFPGFPKDYLCLFLGMSLIPIKVFLVAASVGRMPGTLMLSLQGASVFKGNYENFAILMALLLLMSWLSYRYRESIYNWVEKIKN
ncbi:TVP38/TMEM64 family membrane protein [Candidatus Magnetomoraceae bacterium gMMP-13]